MPRTELLSKQSLGQLQQDSSMRGTINFNLSLQFEIITLILSDTSSRYLGTILDNNRHQTTPKKFFADMLRFMMTLSGVCWSLMVSGLCLLVSDVVWRRVSGEFLKGYLSAVYGRVWGLGSSEGISECSGLVWCNKCFIVVKLRKAKFYTLHTFETS